MITILYDYDTCLFSLELLEAGLYARLLAYMSFFLIMAQHPAIQQKAQDEVDAVIRKQGRPPKCCDRQCMPYLDAVLKEVHRCNPVAPLGEA